jgi:hypothetical protein
VETIAMKQYPKGTYFLKIMNNNESVFSQSIIK